MKNGLSTKLLIFAIFAAATSNAGHLCFEHDDYGLPLGSIFIEPESKECGTVPYPSNTGHVTPDPILSSPDVWGFVSEPTLHPMKVKVVTHREGTSSGLIFVAPYAFSEDATYGQSGSLIMDNDANPIWFRPLSSPNLMNTDFRLQRWDGKPVLTFWQGTLASPPTYTNVPGGSSEPGSCYYILDNSYRVIKTVKAKRGFTSDIHEFLLTPDGTALLLSRADIEEWPSICRLWAVAVFFRVLKRRQHDNRSVREHPL